MCLSFLYIAPPGGVPGAAAAPYSLVLAVNRDEHYARYDTLQPPARGSVVGSNKKWARLLPGTALDPTARYRSHLLNDGGFGRDPVP